MVRLLALLLLAGVAAGLALQRVHILWFSIDHALRKQTVGRGRLLSRSSIVASHENGSHWVLSWSDFRLKTLSHLRLGPAVLVKVFREALVFYRTIKYVAR